MTAAGSTGTARVIDTRHVPWVDPGPGEGFHGTKVRAKVLARDPEGWVSAQLLWVPPGLESINPHHAAERHYHTTVREWVLLIDGELPYREYPSMDATEWKPVGFRRGWFLDRLPGPTSVHGMDPGQGRVHAVCLEIRDGRSTAPGEDGYLQQNVSITDAELAAGVTPPAAVPTGRAPFSPLAGPGVVHATPTVRLLDTLALPWAAPAAGDPLAAVPGALVKPLALSDAGEPYFELAWLPPGAADPAPPRYAYVLAGELLADGQPVRADGFVEVAAGSTVVAGPTGCTALRWRPHR